MVKKVEKREGDGRVNTNEPATTAEVGTGSGENRIESTQEGGSDVEKSSNPQVDKGDKTEATPRERLLAEINEIAAKTFLRVPVDTLYFTADKQGFADLQNAENHSSQLSDANIITINK